MADGITYDLRTDRGEPISVLQQVIELRRKELGETARNAAVATAITVVKSLRASTVIANASKMDLHVSEEPRYFVSWKSVGGRRRRIVRMGNRKGLEVASKSLVDIAGAYQKGEELKVYSVVDMVRGSKEKTARYLVIARDQKSAVSFAKKRHKRRVEKYRGLAKFALTVAMMKISDNGGSSGSVNQRTRKTALDNVKATVSSSGFDKGTVDIRILDALDYATSALQGGEPTV